MNLLIIAFAVAGAVISGVNYRTILILLIVKEDEVGLFSNLAACIGQKYGYVKVKILAAVVFIGIPAETDRNFGQARIGFRQINFLSLR
ncbi:hypothetical protein D3C79_1000390 [compost metagenome]